MTRLIDKDGLVSILNAKADMAWGTPKEVFFSVARMVSLLPDVDAEPVRHGRWIGKPLCGNDDCRCSECGFWENVHAIRGVVTQKYCPNCGAKMDKEDE